MDKKAEAPNPMSLIEKKAADLGVDLAVADETRGILQRLLGPVVTEAGERLALPMRKRRMVKPHEMLTRIEDLIQEHIATSGAERVAVPARGAVPLVEAASLEDDADLSAKYEALLANAALGTGTDNLATFTETLRQMSPLDGQLMQEMFNHHVLQVRANYASGGSDRPRSVRRPHFDLDEKVKTGGGTASRMNDLPDVSYSATSDQRRVSADNLFRLGLLKHVSERATQPIVEYLLRNTDITVSDSDRVRSEENSLPLFQPLRTAVVL